MNKPCPHCVTGYVKTSSKVHWSRNGKQGSNRYHTASDRKEGAMTLLQEFFCHVVEATRDGFSKGISKVASTI